MGSHAYGFTDGRTYGNIWGGSAITPGSQIEMSSLRTEHGGAVGILLILYVLHAYLGRNTNPSAYTVTIWIDNAEVLRRVKNGNPGTSLKDHTVFDYDLWRVMTRLQTQMKFK